MAENKNLITIIEVDGYTDVKNPYDAKAYDSIIASCLNRWIDVKEECPNGKRVKVQVYIYVTREE
jgi:hypothetical protein